MYRSFTDRILGGVCGGLAAALPLNAWLWRLLFVVATPLTVGAAAALYVALWWALPQESPTSPGQGSLLRFVLVLLLGVLVLGGVFVLEASLYLPALLLLLALIFLLRQLRGQRKSPLVGLVAVAAAVLLLLGALDVLPEGIHDLILRSWPVLLVFGGLFIVLRDRMPLGGAAALLLSAALVAGVALTAFSTRLAQPATDNQVELVEAISPDVQLIQLNIETLSTEVEFLAGQPGRIVVRFTGSTESEIQHEYTDYGDGLATFTLREVRESPFPRLEAVGRGALRVELPPDVALALAFAGADGSATFNMADLSLELLNMDLLSGDALVSLPAYQPLSPTVAQNPGHLRVRSGSITILIPSGVGGRFVLNRNRSVRPIFDELTYVLVDDGADGTLEARLYDNFEIRLLYTVTVPAGTLRLDVVPGS